MDLLTPVSFAPPAVRQLRRIRALYASGFVLWAVGAAWEGWHHPGSRQMWVFLLLLALFSGLLCLTVASLWRHRAAVRLRKAERRATARSAGRPLRRPTPTDMAT